MKPTVTRLSATGRRSPGPYFSGSHSRFNIWKFRAESAGEKMIQELYGRSFKNFVLVTLTRKRRKRGGGEVAEGIPFSISTVRK